MVTTLLNTTGKRIRMLRDDLKLTQAELCDAVHKENGFQISQNYLSEVERDKTTPSAKAIAALARYFRVTSDYLLLLSDNPEAPDDQRHVIIPVENIHQRKIAEEAVETLLEMPEDEQEHILKTIRLLRGARRPRIIGGE